MSKLSSTSSSEEPPTVASALHQSERLRRRALRDATRSRRVLTWGAITFVFGTIAASILIDYCPRSIRFPEFESALHRVDRSTSPSPIVFYGSSRFAWGVRTEKISQSLGSEVVSATIPAGDTIVGAPFVHELLQHKNPRLLVIELSPETLSHHSPFMDRHLTRMFTWRDIATTFPDIAHSRVIDRLLNARLFPVYHHSPHFRQWITGTTTEDRDPQLPPDKPGPLDAHRAQRWLRSFKVGGRSLDSLEAMLSECNVRGIPTLLVGVPASSPHRACYTPEIDRAYRDTIKHLENKYYARFVDYTAAIDDKYFADDHHLTYTGSVIFSDMLARDVLIPAISTRASPTQPSTSH